MQTSNDPAVVVDSVSKTYFAGSKSLFGRAKRAVDPSLQVKAVSNVTLVAKKGDAVGILGRNGSGKSTLMRLIGGTESPTSGSVSVSAKPTLLGVSAALQPKLTGLENIELGLLAQGISVDEIPNYSEQIRDFADIGDAVERPMNTYSSGQGARLKFAISTAVQRDILLIDEALATGDATFAEKTKEKMQNFLNGAGTVLLVSHAPETISRICNRAVWLEEGRVVAEGGAEEISQKYREWAAKIARKRYDLADDILAETESLYVAPKIVWL